MVFVLVIKLIHHLEEDLKLQILPTEVLLADKLDGLIDLHIPVVLLNIGLGNRQTINGLTVHGPEYVRPGRNVLDDQPGDELVVQFISVDGAVLGEHVRV